MAEINSKTATTKRGVKGIIKKSTRVDLTPMVDLGFLLITFFVFTTTLSKPTVLKLDVPFPEGNTHIAASAVLTVMLEAGNRIAYYEGKPENNPPLLETDYTPGGIRKMIQLKKDAVQRAMGSADQSVLIIKPTDAASFKNFVDMTDEISINGIKHYFIDEVNEADRKCFPGHFN